MLNKFLKKTDFESYEDFMKNFEVAIPENFNFAYDVMDQWANVAPDKCALLWTNEKKEEREYTFKELKDLTDRTASYFTSLGIGKGDVVMLILKRRCEFWFSILALHKLGAITVPATFLLRKHDIEYRCNAAGVKAIIACGDVDVLTNINEAREGSPTLETFVSIGPDVPDGWEDFQKGISDAPKFVAPHRNESSDPMLMYFTSGTTGNPKMVLHDFTYALGHIVTASYWHNINEESIHLTLADTGWGKAAWGKLYGQWIAGATVFVYDFDKFTPIDILDIISRFNITSFCAPPTVFRFLIKEDLRKYDISSLKYCTVAGEALNPIVFDEWKALTGIQLMEGYGQTETTLSLGTYPWVQPKPGSMGVRNPQYRIEIMDGEGKILSPGQEGEIVIRVENGKKPLGMFKEYFKDQQQTAEAIVNGYYHTKDIARQDEDGYFWFVGRADDIIKSSGYRIGPFEVESALMQHPAVLECAITGVPDEYRGQVIKASIVLSGDYKNVNKEELIKDIQRHVKSVTAPYKYPRIVEFIDELPKTISGKIRHFELREK